MPAVHSHPGTRTRFGGRGRLSVVLRPSLRPDGRIRSGDVVEVRLGDGKIVAGRCEWLAPGCLRVYLPEGAK